MSEHAYTIDEEKSLKAELKQLIEENPNNYPTVILAKSRRYLRDYIEFKTPLLADPKFRMPTKCYWVLNDLTDFPKCKTCGKPITSNIKITLGYSKFCSNRCAQSDPDIIAHAKQTRLERYGDAHYVNSEKAKRTSLARYRC